MSKKKLSQHKTEKEGSTVLTQEEIAQIPEHLRPKILEVQEYFRGPLPRPQDLGLYDKIHPGLAERIVGMAEKDQNYQIQRDKRIDWFIFISENLGILLSFILAIIFIVAAIQLIRSGYEIQGFLFGLAYPALMAVTGNWKMITDVIKKTKDITAK